MRVSYLLSVILLQASLLFHHTALADQSKLRKARLLAELTRVHQQAEQMLPYMAEQIFTAMKDSFMAANPTEEAEDVTALMDAFKRMYLQEALDNIDIFVNRMAVTYASSFSESELEALVQLYQEPVMQEMLDRLPDLMEAGGKAGEQWGRELAEITIQRFIEEYELFASE